MNSELDQHQKMAAQHIDGPCSVVAGPGSGKTRVITYRIANLIKNGVAPQNILSISFTRASALEMKERAVKICGESAGCTFGTFHSAFFRILRAFEGGSIDDVIDEDFKKRTLKNIMTAFSIENSQDDEFISDVAAELSYIKNDMIPAEDFKSESLSGDELLRVFNSYENYKKDMKKIDFDDMLIRTYELLTKNKRALESVRARYKYVLVDEFQDINRVQFETIKLFASSERNIFIVGDEDQSIYGFRGARPEFLNEFESFFSPVKKIVLSCNYRSSDAVINSSNSLIKNNRGRNMKTIHPVRGCAGAVDMETPRDSVGEAEKIADAVVDGVRKLSMEYSDFAVIYRTNMQSRAIVDIFMDHNIPFTVADRIMTVYDHWVAKDVISYLKAACLYAGPDDYRRIINKPFRYISKDSIASALGCRDFIDGLKRYSSLHSVQIRTLDELKMDLAQMAFASPSDAISILRTQVEYDRYIAEYANKRGIKPNGLFEVLDEMQESASYFSNVSDYIEHIDRVKSGLLEQKKNKQENSVTLTTMHGAKGLEFRHVFIIGAVEGIVPHEKCIQDNLEEERRLFYVALTRAMDRASIYAPAQKYGKSTQPSRFLDEIFNNAECPEKGEYLYHKKFKKGMVLEKDESSIKVSFEDGIRVLDCIACFKKKLITIIKKNDN